MPFTGQEPVKEPEPEDEEEEEAPAELKADLDKWRRKAVKAFNASKNAAVTFESDIINSEMHAQIWSLLSGCKSASDVRAVFEQAMLKPAPEASKVGELEEKVKALAEVVKNSVWIGYP